MAPKPYLSRQKASDYLLMQHGLTRSPKYLAKLASIGNGPVFYKVGRDVLYNPVDLDAWAQQKLGAPLETSADHRDVATIMASDVATIMRGRAA